MGDLCRGAPRREWRAGPDHPRAQSALPVCGQPAIIQRALVHESLNSGALLYGPPWTAILPAGTFNSAERHHRRRRSTSLQLAHGGGVGELDVMRCIAIDVTA